MRGCEQDRKIVIASVAKQSIGHKVKLDCFVARAPRNDETVAQSSTALMASANPLGAGRLADHLRLPRQRDRRRQQDHQRLRREDRYREIEARLSAVKPADHGA